MDNQHKFHFISGLPRSGSTLLGALLLQNPRFHAGMSSPVGGMFLAMLNQFSARSEFGGEVTERQRERLLLGLFTSYYSDNEKPVVFDTNRLWSSQLPALERLFPKAKFLCMVRNISWINDSLERQFRNNVFENTLLYKDNNERNTVYSRIEALSQRNRLVGFSYSGLREAFYSEQAANLLIIEYDHLANAPEKVMPLIYRFLDEPEFDHDYDNVNFDAPDFDERLGVAGLHRVRPKVSLIKRRTILPPDLFEKYANMEFWRDVNGSSAHVISAG